MKLLIVEDEREIRDTIADFFKKSGETVITASNTFEAEDRLLTHQFDAVILDITLPDGTGIDLLPVIKHTQDNAGVLILSAKNSLDDKITGLDLGADDYLSKPFHISELNSRVKALVRRNIFGGEERLIFEEVTIDLKENQAYLNGALLTLTKKDYILLLYFVNNKERILTKESIAEHLWGDQLDALDNYDFIYTHIKNLRKKMLGVGGTDYLQTVHGIGYKFGRI